jgi:deazaflavin-dependent oxidoreductase (nitroreductase family)
VQALDQRVQLFGHGRGVDARDNKDHRNETKATVAGRFITAARHCTDERSTPHVTAEPNVVQRALQRFAASRARSWLFSHVMHRVDRALMAASGGRVSTARVLAGLPTVRLTTTGAKTGKRRTVPLMGMLDGERWVLVASNWGSERHPAWYHNLRANPEVELTYRDRTDEYVAREASGDERAAYWERACRLYVGFEAYRRRSDDREIPVVVLEPTGE